MSGNHGSMRPTIMVTPAKSFLIGEDKTTTSTFGFTSSAPAAAVDSAIQRAMAQGFKTGAIVCLVERTKTEVQALSPWNWGAIIYHRRTQNISADRCLCVRWLIGKQGVVRPESDHTVDELVLVYPDISTEDMWKNILEQRIQREKIVTP